MRRGTTPTYTLKFAEGVGETIADICLAFRQLGNTDLILHLSEGKIALNGDIASCTLTQEQTNAFRKGTIQRQIKVKFTDGNVQTTDISDEQVVDVIHEEVI